MAYAPAVIKELPPQQVKNMYFDFPAALPTSPAAKGMDQALAKYYPSVAPSALATMGWVPCTIFAHAFQQATSGGKQPTRAALLSALNGMSNFSNGYVSNITYASRQGVTSPHVPRPQELVAKWKGTAMHVVAPFADTPKVPGQPGQ